jgi:hypothetical protein
MSDAKTGLAIQDDGIIIRRVQDVQAVLDGNKEVQVHGQEPDLRMGRRFASVPQVILEKWIEEGIDYRKINSDPQTKKRFMQKLSDPEFLAFRTHTGVIC